MGGVWIVHVAADRDDSRSGANSGAFPYFTYFLGPPMVLAARATPLGPPRTSQNRLAPRCHAAPAGGAQLYVTRWPLAGLEGVDAALPPALADPAALHEAVIVVERSGGGGADAAGEAAECWLFDFLPQNAADPAVLAMLLTGEGVPGQARARQLGGGALPRRRRAAGVAAGSDAVARAAAVAAAWDGTELRLFRRDCRHFVAALLTELTDTASGLSD